MLFDVVADVFKELYFGEMVVDVEIMTIVRLTDHQVQHFTGSHEYLGWKDEDFRLVLLALEKFLWVGGEELKTLHDELFIRLVVGGDEFARAGVFDVAVAWTTFVVLRVYTVINRKQIHHLVLILTTDNQDGLAQTQCADFELEYEILEIFIGGVALGEVIEFPQGERRTIELSDDGWVVIPWLINLLSISVLELYDFDLEVLGLALASTINQNGDGLEGEVKLEWELIDETQWDITGYLGLFLLFLGALAFFAHIALDHMFKIYINSNGYISLSVEPVFPYLRQLRTRLPKRTTCTQNLQTYLLLRGIIIQATYAPLQGHLHPNCPLHPEGVPFVLVELEYLLSILSTDSPIANRSPSNERPALQIGRYTKYGWLCVIRVDGIFI